MGDKADWKRDLILAALKARRFAYAPYSHYRVGAAILSEDDRICTGCNVENASYGATNCAERTALFKAVSVGIRNFKAIAITGGPEQEDALTSYCSPCGICRQALREFCDPEQFTVIMARSPEDYREMKLAALLPESFGPDFLQPHAVE